MNTITETEWNAWLIQNEPKDAVVKVFADHREAWALLNDEWLKWILIEG